MTDSSPSTPQPTPPPPSNDGSYGDTPEQVDMFSWKGLTYHPCFRPVMLTSLTSAASVSFITALRSRSLLRASSFFVYTLCGIAAVSWPLCRVQQKKKATNVRTIMEQNSATGHQRDAATVAADRAEIERDAARAKQRQQSQ